MAAPSLRLSAMHDQEKDRENFDALSGNPGIKRPKAWKDATPIQVTGLTVDVVEALRANVKLPETENEETAARRLRRANAQ